MNSATLRGRAAIRTMGAVLLAVLQVACSATLPHDLDARNARDYTAPRSVTSSAAAELEALAVLLIPTNTTVVLPNFTPMLSHLENINHERCVGSARVFLPPGKRSFEPFELHPSSYSALYPCD